MAFVRKETFYEILGVKRTSSLQEIQTQFEEQESFWKSLSLHSPQESELKLIELRTAFSVLSDNDQRNLYNETLDFEFVLLDGKPKDEDIEEAYEVYRHNHKKTYVEILTEFQQFKEDLGSTLWLLKTTTLYLIFSLFLYSGMILLLTIISEKMTNQTLSFTKLKHLFVPIYICFACIGYFLFRKYVQIPTRNKRKNSLDVV